MERVSLILPGMLREGGTDKNLESAMIITKTPFRMSFFGGGTDIPEFFNENGGAVLSTTFDKYCYVNVRHLPRFFDYSTELTYSKTERVTKVEDIRRCV